MCVIYAERQLNFGELAEAVFISSPLRVKHHSLVENRLNRGPDDLWRLVVFKFKKSWGSRWTGPQYDERVYFLCCLRYREFVIPVSLRNQNACHLEMVPVTLNYMCGLEEPVERYVYNTWIQHPLKSNSHSTDFRWSFLILGTVFFGGTRRSLGRGTQTLFLYLQFKDWITSYPGLSLYEY